MISIIITAYKEEKTVGKAIESFLNQKIKGDFEILVACPDEGTKKVIESYSKKDDRVIWVKDPGKGKPIALNICFKKAKGDIYVLSDGDVYVSENSVNELLKVLEDEKVGAVTSRPISISPRNTMMGYYSRLLTDVGAHDTRLKFVNEGKFIPCSGYLFAMKKLFDKIPEDALSDDAVMSHMVWDKGYKIGYAAKAEVYEKYPDSFKDWVLQKKRSAGGYNQLKEFFPKHKRMRSFVQEIKEGWYKPFTYPRNLREFYWTITLYFARLYLWGVIYRDINLKKESFSKTWQRVESTK